MATPGRRARGAAIPPPGSTSRSLGGGSSPRRRPWPTTTCSSDNRSRRSTTCWRGACASRRSATSWNPSLRATTMTHCWPRTSSGSARRSSDRPRSVTSTRSSSTSARCGSVAAGRSPRTGIACPSSTSRTPRRSAAPAIPSGRRAGPLELDLELEVGALVDTPAFNLSADRAIEAIGGYFVLNDWSARDLQRDEMPVRMGPAKGKDFATSIGPWLVTPDEVADAWATGATGPDLAMTAFVTDVDGRRTAISDGRWASARYSFGEMLARASADVHLRPGEVLGSGTVGTGCLLEVKDATLGSLAGAGRHRDPVDRAPRIAHLPRGGASPVTAWRSVPPGGHRYPGARR